jgi:RNA polymerase sigma-70 factor (ECF subfamily)
MTALTIAPFQLFNERRTLPVVPEGLRQFEAPPRSTRPAAPPLATPFNRLAPSLQEEESLPLDDQAWIARVNQGDESAAKSLFDRLYPTIIRCVRSRLPRRTSEEDLVQAIFTRVFVHLHQFSGTVPLEHWVSRIAVNTCLNFLKYERVRPELRMSDLREEEEAVVRQMLQTVDEVPTGQANAARELLERLLSRLRPDERRVITLLHIEERTIKEIADLTGWSITLVKVKAFRTRQKLRKLWESLTDSERP